MDRIALMDAPSNLGLRPPDEGVAPGVYKLPGALRDTGLLERLDAVDRGVVTPPRYSPVWDGARVRNEDVSEVDVAVLGVREGDPYLDEMRQAGFAVWTSADITACGARQIARAALERVGAGHLDGFWIHLDADVVDPTVFPAVDTPVSARRPRSSWSRPSGPAEPWVRR